MRDGVAEVETAAGAWTAAVTEKAEAGATVWLSVRPEAVQLHTDKTGGPNVFKAQLHGTIYLGEVAQHAVELPGGVTLKALETRPKLVARDDASAETRIYIDPVDVQVLME